MAKLVDALVSGTSVSNDVQVRVLFWAQKPLIISGFVVFISEIVHSMPFLIQFHLNFLQYLLKDIKDEEINLCNIRTCNCVLF